MSPVALGQGIDAEMTNSYTAMQNQEWEKALSLLQSIHDNVGERAFKLYGPRFGTVYFRKAYCELKVAQQAARAGDADRAAEYYEKAAESAKTCYIVYKNDKVQAKDKNDGVNMFEKRTIHMHGEAQQGLGNYQEALNLYDQYLRERDKDRDKLYPTPGVFALNRAYCCFSLEEPQLEKGIEFFESALVNKEAWRSANPFIMRTFQVFTAAVVKSKNEQAMVDFLTKNRKYILLDPYEMYEFVPVFLQSGAGLLEANMYRGAYECYSFIPESKVVVEDLNARLASLAGTPGIRDGRKTITADEINKTLSRVEEKIASGDPVDTAVLNALLFLHDKAKNTRGVYAILQQLESFYSNSAKREDNLFNLTRVSAVLGQHMETEKFGSRFLAAYPDSDHCETVRGLMVTSLFYGGEYDKSLEVSQRLLDSGNVPEGSEQHDTVLHVLGGSHYYLGHFDEAQPLLDEHVAKYPESQFAQSAMYFQASNLTRLQEWATAAKKLDAFLEKYPKPAENIYTPFALFDRANCHYTEEEYAPALVCLNRIEKEFNGAPVIEMVFNLKANILEFGKEYSEAEKYYKMALERAEARDNRMVAGEALNFLIGLLGMEKIDKEDNPRIKEAIPYYDKFMTKYSDSPFKPQAVVFAYPAMKLVGRADESLEHLQNVITELANREGAPFLEESINAYTDNFQDNGGDPEKLKDLYYDFPGVRPDNVRARALLRVAVIGVYDELIKSVSGENGNKALEDKYRSQVRALFRNLRQEFDPAKLDNLVLLTLGDYLREKTQDRRESVVYYEQILKGKNNFGQDRAMFGIADVLSDSDQKGDLTKALEMLKKVKERTRDDREQQEKAIYRMITVNSKLGNWSDVNALAREYLDDRHTKNAALVGFNFAESYDKLGKREDAIFNYGSVIGGNTGYILISAPSMKRLMELTWQRNKAVGDELKGANGSVKLTKSDRQSAYDAGEGYISSTRRIIEENDKITDKEIALWRKVEDLVKQYEKSGEIKTKKEQDEEKNRR